MQNVNDSKDRREADLNFKYFEALKIRHNFLAFLYFRTSATKFRKKAEKVLLCLHSLLHQKKSILSRFKVYSEIYLLF